MGEKTDRFIHTMWIIYRVYGTRMTLYSLLVLSTVAAAIMLPRALGGHLPTSGCRTDQYNGFVVYTRLSL